MTRKTGSHLTYAERCHISAYLKSGKSARATAKLVGCSHTTINAELKRNKGLRGYRYHQAHNMARNRRKITSSKPSKMAPSTIELITAMLIKTQSSPEQIAGRLALKHNIKISHESIYKLIWKDKSAGGELYLHLRHRAKKYNKRGSKKSGRGLIPNRVDISERPAIVEDKSRFGDFELDTIVGAKHQGAIVSSVDRASKFVFLDVVARAKAKKVRRSLCKSLKSLGEKGFLFTFTSDNGKEFSEHEKIAKKLGVDFYFARPYHAWERGLNEHTNGLVRQYFPKGTNFRKVSVEEVLEVARKLNDRPRKILNFQTPAEVFLNMTAQTRGGNFRS